MRRAAAAGIGPQTGQPPYPASQALRFWLEYLGESDGEEMVMAQALIAASAVFNEEVFQDFVPCDRQRKESYPA